MALFRVVTLQSVALVLATCAAAVAGFFFASAVLGGDSPSESAFPRAVDPAPAQHLKLTPDDPEFDSFPIDFQDFPIYWLGDEFEGHPLRYIIRHVSSPDSSPSENKVAFLYGTCQVPAEGGCPPPIQVIVEPYCLVPPTLVNRAPGASGVSALRGNATSMEVGGGLRVWTGDVTLKLYASDTELLDQAAANFISPNGLGPAGAGDDLPAPRADCSDYEMVPHP